MSQFFSRLYTQARSSRSLRKFRAQVHRINALEPAVSKMSNEALRSQFLALTSRPFTERVEQGFALVREASRRALGLRQFDVQLIGGLALLNGQLAEMRTGEGKTLTIVAPAALLALEHKGVHVVTSNSYLAARDAEAMRPVYEALGLSVSAIHEQQPLLDKKAAYQANVTYGVGHEFGFDYLKDNTATSPDARVQDGLYAAIVDEVDSILIDEARVPMILSASAQDVSSEVLLVDRIVREFVPGQDYTVDLKKREAVLTDAGYAAAEGALQAQGVIAAAGDLYKGTHTRLAQRLGSAVRAYALHKRDRDYVVENGELVLVDTGTGRKMEGRRLSEGLQEALEAKEGLQVKRGTLTQATITYQNFFSLYERLSGLTGTAATDADEFSEIYSLETVVIPPNRPSRRVEHADQVYLTKSEKFTAVVREVAERHAKRQPVLVGCATVRDAEVVSRLLHKQGLSHQLLTAKHIEREAAIIAEAGRPGAVTVATNMAGRGTDILLGGSKPVSSEHDALARWEAERDEVLGAGGLCVLGAERNGLRRVDNQLAGRCGRQGDPGEVLYFLSLEDELLKALGESRQLAMVRRLVSQAGGVLSGSAISSLVQSAQARTASAGFEARRSLMKFDSVLADQRSAVFGLRAALLDEVTSTRPFIQEVATGAALRWFELNATPQELPEQWDASALKRGLAEQFGIQAPVLGWVHKEELSYAEMATRLEALVLARAQSLEQPDEALRSIVLRRVDAMWSEHLTMLDELSSAVSLKGHTGFNPVFQYHKDAFELFGEFRLALYEAIAVELLSGVPQQQAKTALTPAGKVALELERRWVARNDACPCGSGKRFKLCHGKLT